MDYLISILRVIALALLLYLVIYLFCFSFAQLSSLQGGI